MTYPALLDPAAFAGHVRGRPVHLLALSTPGGLHASVCTQGARLLQLVVPGRGGQWHDVVLGVDSLAQLQAGTLSSLGVVVGRYANRIGGSRFKLDGREVRVPPNEGPNCLHGGPGGSRHQVFEVLDLARDRAVLVWTAGTADDGFPGRVRLEVTYTLCGPGELRITWSARVLDGPTVSSVTTHPFFNLEGTSVPHVRHHRIAIEADHMLPVDAALIPTGEIRPVDGTPFDLRHGPVLDAAQARLPAGQRGFDHCWVQDLHARDGQLRRMAWAQAPASGIRLETWSDQPGIQLFTAGGFDGRAPRLLGKGGSRFGPCSAFCLEPQQLPDAPNHAHFPSTRLAGGQVRRGTVSYRFSVAS